MNHNPLLAQIKRAIKTAHYKAQQAKVRESVNDFLVHEYEDLLKKLASGEGSFEDLTERINQFKAEEGLIVK